MEERQIVLDFTGCKYITEVHWRIRDTFHFPDFYGENLDEKVVTFYGGSRDE